jgi:hypothetical protein
MVTLILALVLTGFASADLDENGNVFAVKNYFSCAGQLGKLEFVLHRSTHVIEWQNVEGFGRAEMIPAPFGAKIDAQEDRTEVSFVFDWYFTAEYQLTLPPISAWSKGQGQLILNGDDQDGIWFRDEKFQCQIR